MKTIPKKEWPEWIKARIPDSKNKELKSLKGYFYLYEYKNSYDKTRKKSYKTTKYLGVLKEQCGRIYEHGHVAFLLWLLSEHKIIKKIKKYFLNEWKELSIFILNRTISPFPLKRIGSWADKTTIKKYFNINSLSGKKLSKILARVGTNVKNQSAFMKELIEDKELLLYDGSIIHSDSKYNRLLEIGYDKDKLFLPKANISLLFSKNRNIPIYFRLFFGSVHEIRTVKTVVEELKDRNIIFIADKGYYKNKLFEELNDSGIKFIIPLPRDDKRIGYEKEFKGIFEYRNRIIKYTSYKSGKYMVYHYEDQHLKYEETTQGYKLKLAGKKIKFNENWAGKIALLSNKKIKPKEAYLLWKSRDQIEKAFDTLQNYLELDYPYVSREDVFRGYVFGTFVSLLSYYLILNRLKKYEINDKVSVEDVLFEFSKVMVEEKNFYTFAEIPKKVIKLAKKLKVYNIITKLGES